MWLLGACVEPARLDRVEQALADELAAEAEPSLRLFTALTGFVAETCGVEPVDEHHLFEGDAAEALGVTQALQTTSEVWTFEDVGLDGDDGTLTLTNVDRESFSIAFSGETAMSADLEMTSCTTQEGLPAAVPRVNGTAQHQVDGDEVALTTFGTFLVYQVDILPPREGQIRWTSGSDEVTLDDASGITDTWPGVASSKDWDRPVAIALP